MPVFDTLYQPDLFDLVTDVEGAIASLELGDTFSIYEILHRAAERIARVDAAYVCLYSEEQQTLFFPYKWDSGSFDQPATFPLGQGPTSRAIKCRQPVLWNRLEDAPSPRGRRFGERSRVCQSAIHLPMLTTAGESEVLGVFSVQSYAPDAYNDHAVRMLQWLAARGAMALRRARFEAEWQVRMAAAEARAVERQRHMLEMADAFVGIVHHITEEAQALVGKIPGDARTLRREAVHLCRSCYRAEAEANAMPLRAAPAHAARERQDPPVCAPVTPEDTEVSSVSDGDIPAPCADFSTQLTEREQDILRLVAAGDRNADIARDLFISVDTVKFHLSNIYRKLGVSNRVQAVRMVQGTPE